MTIEKVWPDADDGDLFARVSEVIEEQHPGRFAKEHIYASFSAACAEFDEHVAVERIIKKTKVKCVWERPVIPPEVLQRIDDEDV